MISREKSPKKPRLAIFGWKVAALLFTINTLGNSEHDRTNTQHPVEAQQTRHGPLVSAVVALPRIGRRRLDTANLLVTAFMVVAATETCSVPKQAAQGAARQFIVRSLGLCTAIYQLSPWSMNGHLADAPSGWLATAATTRANSLRVVARRFRYCGLALTGACKRTLGWDKRHEMSGLLACEPT